MQALQLLPEVRLGLISYKACGQFTGLESWIEAPPNARLCVDYAKIALKKPQLCSQPLGTWLKEPLSSL